MSEKKNRKLPARGLRIPAAILALIMTFCLWAAQMSWTGVQALTSTEMHQKAAAAADVVDLQMARIQEQMEKLGADQGFDPAPMLEMIQREQVAQYDREVAAWWTEAMATGKMGAEPLYRLEGAVEALQAQADFMASLDPMMANAQINRVAGEAEEIVQHSAVLFRDMLVETGVRMAGERVNLPQMTALMRKIPPLTGLIALLCAGLIALIMSRRIQVAGQYIGGALSAVGLLMIFEMIGMKILNLRGMIAEASTLLETQYVHVARTITLETLGGAVLLMALGGGLLAWAGKEYKRHEA